MIASLSRMPGLGQQRSSLEMTHRTHDRTCKLTDAHTRAEVAAAIARCGRNIPGVRFLPWVGSNYGKGDFVYNKRLLVLGVSHYEWCELCWETGKKRAADLTCRCVAEHAIDGSKTIPHWHSIDGALTGRDLDQADRYRLWHKIAYYNYVQQMVGFFPGGGRPPRATSAMYRNAQAPFREVLNLLSPDIVIVLGPTLWKKLPEEDGNLPTIEADGKSIERCFYKIGDKRIMACCVLHPAARFNGLGKGWFSALRSTIMGTAPE